MGPNNIEHIGDLFRKKLLDFESDPPKEVWQELSSKLPHKSPFKKWWFWSASALILAVVAVLIWNLSGTEQETQSVVPVAISVVDKPVTSIETIVRREISDSIKLAQVENETITNSATTEQSAELPESKSDPISSDAVSEMEETETSTQVETYFDESEVIDQPESFYNEKLWETIRRVVDSEEQEVLNTVDFSVDTVYTRGPEQQICRGEEAILIAPNGSGFVWSSGDVEPSIVVEPEESTTYYVAYVDSTGQQSMGEITVTVINCSIFIPNAFSPNGDGLNDIFKPQGSGLTHYQLVILSTWGDKVFESQDPEQGWDGGFKGNCAPSGMYLYSLNFVDSQGISHKKYGSIMLLD